MTMRYVPSAWMDEHEQIQMFLSLSHISKLFVLCGWLFVVRYFLMKDELGPLQFCFIRILYVL